MIYLDNSATTPLAPEVSERMERFRRGNFANASSVHRGGQCARVAIEEVRERLAEMLNAEAKEIVFTSGGTESDNLALKGYAFSVFAVHRRFPAIITTPTEHHAVLHPVEFLKRMGADVRYVAVDADGRVRPEALMQVLDSVDKDIPPLVSIMYANNETGVINNLNELSRTVHDAGGVLHSDAVQAFGKLSCVETGADMISVSAHKIHGPKAIGALYVAKHIELEPQMHGGAQERNRRGGTEAPELIVGFDEAMALVQSSGDVYAEHIARLNGILRQALSEVRGAYIVTPTTNALNTIINLTFDDAAMLDGEGLIVGMDMEGVAISNGSACTSGSPQPSHVLAAIGFPPEQARAAVRFSLSRYNTEEEIVNAVDALKRVVGRMRGGKE